MKNRTIIFTVIRTLVFACASAGILLLFASSSTLLYPQVADDCVVFETIGLGWLNGLVPYRDIFDHKGPLMYVIQMAGLSLGNGKIGLFLLELIFYTVYLEIIYKIGRTLSVKPFINVLSIIASLLFIAAYVDTGNNVEGWSMPFVALPILLVTRFLLEKGTHLAQVSYISGLCLGAIAMLRINNCCIILGLALGLVIYFIMRANYKPLFKSILWFSAGCATIIIPFITYFAWNGALYDFIYCNLIFNLHYKAVWDGGYSTINTLVNLRPLMPCLLLVGVTLICAFKRIQQPLAICTGLGGVITFLTFITGACYSHYFLLVAPIASLCILMAAQCGKWPTIITTIFAIVPVAYWNHNIPSIAIERIDREMRNSSALELASNYIPAADSNSVYTFGDFRQSNMLLAEKRIPVGKYFFLQSKIKEVDDYIKKDMTNRFVAASSKWILSSERIDASNWLDISSTYDLIGQPEESLYVYKRKD